MQARAALFDLYGDHVRVRGGAAPVSALVRLLAPLDVQPAAVRTAVSRMTRQGWLEAVRLPSGAGYRLTTRALVRLEASAVRIYRTRDRDWDGCWHLLSLESHRRGAARERLAGQLAFLGYGPLDDTTWISPRPSPEVQGLLEVEGVTARPFSARFEGDPKVLAAQAWDLESLADAYRAFVDDGRSLVATVEPWSSDEEIFAIRSELVHAWRNFLFRDPGLPRTLLPDDWPGEAAADWFDGQAARLQPAATRFVEGCLASTRS